MGERMMLGWRPPLDRSHEERYALATAMPAKPSPVVIGIEWHVAFDTPTQGPRGSWWIGTTPSWGEVRGGHAVCLRPPSIPDLSSRWLYANQGSEGSCVGWACSCAQVLANRRLYNGWPLYQAAQGRDAWPGSETVDPRYTGTSVNAGLDTLRLDGAWRGSKSGISGPIAADGITAFRWARTVDEVMAALGSTEPFVRVLNSWGKNYPREVRLSLDGLKRLMDAGGEFGVPTDR